jgi:O-antigen/teichoic acid export membrane protein
LRQILLQGTRLSLAMVVPVAVCLIMLADPLVHAWLKHNADKVAGCIPVIQILAVAVTIRVGNSTGTTLLKGAGEHRLVAWANLGTGVVNLILSVVLIRSFGLTGVAWGTLIPIAAAACFVLYPAACRRVGLPLGRAIVHSILPAVWPALIVAGLLAFTRHISSGTLLAVALQAVLGGVVYLGLFFTVAIGKRDRADYVAKVTQVTRRRRLQPAEGL